MADLKNFVKKIVKELLKTEYPHTTYPSVLVARIVTKASDGQQYVYAVRVMDRHGAIDSEIPELPDVICDKEYAVGQDVVIVLMYGQLQPYIIGRWSV